MPPRTRSLWPSLLSALIVFGFLAVLLFSLATMDYQWSFGFLQEYFWIPGQEGTSDMGRPGLLLQGLWGTLWISFCAILIGLIFGIGLGVVMTKREPVSYWAGRFLVDVLRNTPVLVQLYVAYFVVGTAFDLTATTAGVWTLGLFCGAYIAELTRVQIEVFEKGQLDAARSLGLSDIQVALHIMTPQIGRRMLPALVGQLVSLVKDSSLVSVISLMELTKAGLNVVSLSFRSFETWFVIAAMYFFINQNLSSFGRHLERKLARAEGHEYG
jgi:polar amino acid transport system permease protein